MCNAHNGAYEPLDTLLGLTRGETWLQRGMVMRGLRSAAIQLHTDPEHCQWPLISPNVDKYQMLHS